MRNLFKKYKSHFIILFLLMIFLFQTTAYSAFSATIKITGDSYARVDSNIRITSILVSSITNNSISEFEDFNKESTKIQVNLPSENSTIRYEITITNKSSNDYLLTNIEEQNNTNSNVEYKIEEIEILDTITKNSTKKFYLTLNNKTGYTNQTTTLNLKYTFELDEVSPPIITGGSTNWTATPLNISVLTPGTSLVGIKEYEYYISETSEIPLEEINPTGLTNSGVNITTEGINYIFFRSVANNNKKSSWSNYQISKLDTASPVIALDIENTINDTSNYNFPTSSDLGLSGGTVSCIEKGSNQTITKATNLNVGDKTIECTATKNNGLTKTISKSVNVIGYYTATTSTYNLSAMDNAYKSGDTVVLPPDVSSIQYGPYKAYDAGIYFVTIEGTNLNLVKGIESYYNGRASNIKVPKNINSITSTTITYKVNIPQAVDDMEFVIRHSSEETATIKSVKVEKSSNFEYYYGNALRTEGGTTSGTSIILSGSNQFTFGPYKPISAGTYKLIIKGQNVDKISKVVVVEYQNETKGTATLVSSTSTEATYQITIPVDYINSGLELYLYGLDDTEITIDNYIIEK